MLSSPKVFQDNALKCLRFTLAGSNMFKQHLDKFECQEELQKKLVKTPNSKRRLIDTFYIYIYIKIYVSRLYSYINMCL